MKVCGRVCFYTLTQKIMTQPKKHKVFISPTGTVHTIHDDQLTASLQALGKVTVRRATHVETYADLDEDARAYLRDIRQLLYAECTVGTQWFADMRAVCPPEDYRLGDAVLGPFESRDAALRAEVERLEQLRCPLAGDR